MSPCGKAYRCRLAVRLTVTALPLAATINNPDQSPSPILSSSMDSRKRGFPCIQHRNLDDRIRGTGTWSPWLLKIKLYKHRSWTSKEQTLRFQYEPKWLQIFHILIHIAGWACEIIIVNLNFARWECEMICVSVYIGLCLCVHICNLHIGIFLYIYIYIYIYIIM